MPSDYSNPVECAVHCHSCDRCFDSPATINAHRTAKGKCRVRPVLKEHVFEGVVGRCDTYPKPKGNWGYVSVWKSWAKNKRLG